MMECVFNHKGKCIILVNSNCHEKCKFKKSEVEFTSAQLHADDILEEKGLIRKEIINENGERIMTTERIEENDRS